VTAWLVLRRVVLFVALPVLLFVAWWYASADSVQVYQPPLKTILSYLPSTWRTLLGDLVPSLTRLLSGYILALIVGIGVGVLIGSSRWLRALTEPLLEFLRAIPPPVLVPIIILVAGIGDLTKVLVVLSGCVWPILLNTVEGVRAVDSVVLETARSYGVTGPARITRVILPSAGPQIAAGLRQALSIAIILMVISEMFAASNGLGFTIVQFQRSFAIPEMWSGIILLGLLGFGLSELFRLAERRALAWYHGLRDAQRRS